MDRSRRGGGQRSRPQPPSSSRLTVKARQNRRRPESLWARMPKPTVVADACGRALRRAVPAAAGACVLFAIGSTAWAGYRFVTTSPRFAITTIEVHGNQRVSDEQILAEVPARIGDNVFGTNLDGVVASLRENPWIASAEAHRVLPHTLVIEVREHAPAAIVQLGGFYLVDADGHPFKRLELAADLGSDRHELPIITGLDRTAYVADPAGTAAEIRAAVAALALWTSDSERPAIGEVHLGTHGALTLVTYEHAISIQLGTLDGEAHRAGFTPTLETDLALRIQTFDATWAELSPGERARARAIHLDARPDQVTVALEKDS